MIRKHGYKILGVLILLYVFLAGLLVPLKPGIVQVKPQSLRTDTAVTIEVRGYNVQYDLAEGQLRAWLKLDDQHTLAAEAIEVRNARDLSLRFRVPEYLPATSRVKDAALIIDSPHDGAHVLPSAVFITQDSIDPEQAGAVWMQTPVEGLHTAKGIRFPFRNILAEGIRNTYFHVPLWFSMLFLLGAAVYFSILHLRKGLQLEDYRAEAFTKVGILFGALGLITGAIWAKNTWGAYWSWDVKQNMTAIALLIYLAYFVLRRSFDDPEKRARVSAVYNIFAFATLIPLLFVIPRMTDSLHPGSGGNPAIGSEDLDHTMRLVFYPAIIGWSLLGVWIANLAFRTKRLLEIQLEQEADQLE
jgi:heme exporter protein C